MNKQRNSQMYREDVIGGKTGYTDIARHTLVTVAKHGEIELIAVVLKSERDSLYTDTNALLDYGINSYKELTLHSPNVTLKTLPMYTIKSGQPYQAGNCSISVEKSLSVLANKDIKERDIITDITLPDYIEIGKNKGSIVGSITYLHDNKILAKNNLLIKDIEFLPSPYATVLPVQNEILPHIPVYLIVIPFLLIFVFLLFLKIKKSRRKTKLKFNKHIR
jgi:D-alanyl-D-alanine carboxypeptidase